MTFLKDECLVDFKKFTKNSFPDKKTILIFNHFSVIHSLVGYVALENKAKWKFKTLKAIFSKQQNAAYQLCLSCVTRSEITQYKPGFSSKNCVVKSGVVGRDVSVNY